MPAGVLGMGTWCPAPVSVGGQVLRPESAGRGGGSAELWAARPVAAEGFGMKVATRVMLVLGPRPPLPTGGPWAAASPCSSSALAIALPRLVALCQLVPGPLGEPSAGPSRSLEGLDCVPLTGRWFLSGKLFRGDLSPMRSAGPGASPSGCRPGCLSVCLCRFCIW